MTVHVSGAYNELRKLSIFTNQKEYYLMEPNNHLYVISAAGGNATAIRILEHALPRAEYEEKGKQLMAETEKLGAEQCGFLIPSENHFEMAGGEFCGNAARAAALLFSKVHSLNHVSFTMSGFSGKVSGEIVETADKNKFDVRCVFPGMEISSRELKAQGYSGVLVDLGGIVHFVINAPFPKNYEEIHRAITKELGLEERDAVGVVWIQKEGKSIVMHPVVWVRSIDTFFYETSCGSGTIAVGKVTGERFIVQPSGGTIEAIFFGDQMVVLRSVMEVIHET